MDISFETIPVFNQTRRLYQETHMKYMVSNLDRPNNTPFYSIHSNLDSFILYNESDINEQIKGNEEEFKPSEQNYSSPDKEIDDQNSKKPKK